MKKEFIMPVLVLSLICVFVTGVLAIGHTITQPIIQQAAAERARMAMVEILPDATGFNPIDKQLYNLPASVQAAYRTANYVGYAFIVTTFGFGGEMSVIIGVDMDGRVIRTAVLSDTETPSFSGPVFAYANVSQYWGRDRNNIETVAIISGSTVTAVAFKNAVRYALDAFALVMSEGE